MKLIFLSKGLLARTPSLRQPMAAVATYRPAWVLVAGSIVAFASFTPGSAFAQSCNNSALAWETGNLATLTSSLASNINASITATNLAFLSQSTAFVSAPADAPQDATGAGVWSRSVIGEFDLRSSSTTTVNSVTNPGTPQQSQVGYASGVQNCRSTIHSSYTGIQFGTDIAKLNIGDWNVHTGVTVGGINAQDHLNGGLNAALTTAAFSPVGAFGTSVQAPFVGTYVAATYKGFYVDALLRGDFYQETSNGPGINVYNQNLSAHGFSIAGSAGYHYTIPDTEWFVEPSVGIVRSQVTLGAYNSGGSPGGSNIQGTLNLGDITDTIGRVGLRFGTSVTVGDFVLQPFASASVWRDFNTTNGASYTTCPGVSGSSTGCVFFGAQPALITAAYKGTNVGTFGQYSVGISGQIANSGWLGFVRGDFREGANILGWSGSAGVRYQFDTFPSSSPRIVKGPIEGPRPVNWTGVYVGGLAGTNTGLAHLEFTSGSLNVNPHGLLGGAQLGYNYQSGEWVLGVEADFDASGTKGSANCAHLISNTLGANLPLYNMTCSAESDWLATVTGRAGYAWERLLFFGKAGVAFKDESISASCNLGPNNGSLPGQSCANPAGVLSNGFSARAIQTGWTTGLGFEFALTDNWSTKAEVNYAGFAGRGDTANDGSAIHGWSGNYQAKVGLNYRFAQ